MSQPVKEVLHLGPLFAPNGGGYGPACCAPTGKLAYISSLKMVTCSGCLAAVKMHDALVFPHGISCPICVKTERCNECGKTFDTFRRCTNARCPDCCPRACHHQTQ